MKRAVCLIVAAAIAAISLPALAQYGGNSPNQPNTPTAAPNAALAPQPLAATALEGRILDNRALALPQGTVGLRMQIGNGAIVLLDLGNPQNLAGLAVQPGAYVMVRGREGFYSGVPVFYVSEIAPVFLVNRGAGAPAGNFSGRTP